MKKILTIKTDKEGVVDIQSRVPDFMTEAEVNDRLTYALPMAVAGLAREISKGSIMAARAEVLAMFEKADTLLTMLSCEEDSNDDDCCCEGDEHSDDRPCGCCGGAGV